MPAAVKHLIIAAWLPQAMLRQYLRTALGKWVARARAAGLDDDNMYALFGDVVRPPTVSRVA